MAKRVLLSVIIALTMAASTGAASPPGPGELREALARLYKLDWAQVTSAQARKIWPVELVCSSQAHRELDACDGTLMLSSSYFVRDGDCFACDTLVFARRFTDGRCAETLISVTVRRLSDYKQRGEKRLGGTLSAILK